MWTRNCDRTALASARPIVAVRTFRDNNEQNSTSTNGLMTASETEDTAALATTLSASGQ
jgi:hypothetical protein